MTVLLAKKGPCGIFVSINVSWTAPFLLRQFPTYLGHVIGGHAVDVEIVQDRQFGFLLGSYHDHVGS